MEKWNIAIGSIAFFGFITLYAFEIQYWNRYLDRSSLLLTGLLTGVGLAIFALLLLRKRLPDNWEGRVRIVLGVSLLSLALGPLLLSLSNRWLSFTTERVPVEFLREDPRYTSRTGVVSGKRVQPSSYFSYFYLDNRLYRVSVEQPLFAGAEEGSTAELRLERGFWGFDLVIP